ncbi:lipocalin family protein [Niabella sp. CJ426]|uniref:lipocalin family protein n=1 Tax=Niabella sp. CJ426 TaxID=3393740 RepID=UPI003D014F35
MNLKNYSVIFLFATLLSCSKGSDTKLNDSLPEVLIAKKWQPQTRQILEKGYDNTVQVNPSSEIWNFRTGGIFVQQSCDDCPDQKPGAWSLSSDKQKLTVVFSSSKSIEYSIVSLTRDRLVIKGVDLVGTCGVFDTTGEPGWEAPASCPTGVVQYELTMVK